MHDSPGWPPSAPQTQEGCHHTYFSCLPNRLFIWFCLLGPCCLLPLIQISVILKFSSLLASQQSPSLAGGLPQSLNPHQAFVQTRNLSSLDYLLQESFPRLCCQNYFPSHKPEYFEKRKITSCHNRVKLVHDSWRPKLLAVWPLFLCLTSLSTLCLLPFRPSLPRVPASGFCFNCGFF